MPPICCAAHCLKCKTLRILLLSALLALSACVNGQIGTETVHNPNAASGCGTGNNRGCGGGG